MDVAESVEFPPHPTDTVMSRLRGLDYTPVGRRFHRFPDLVDAMREAGLHVLEGSWGDGAENELAPFQFDYFPEPTTVLAALRPALSRRVIETIRGARRRGVLPPGRLDVCRVGLVGEVPFAVARVLATHQVAIEPPDGGEAVGWTEPLRVLGWVGRGEGGGVFLGVDGTRVGDWDGARAAAEAWIAGARGRSAGSPP